MGEATRWVWVPHDETGFAKAQLVAEDETAGTCSVKANGEVITLKSSLVNKVNPSQFDRAGDIAELTYLNEPSVVYNLSQRYAHDQIYTYSGLFLVAVNPYKAVEIYGDNVIAEYKNKRREDGAPHIYAVAEQAYREMLETKSNQSILVTGESGAGKTENTKKVIRYLSAVTGSRTKSEAGHGIDEQILQTNPVLEAFGNAQTIRNANSSRFGKFIRIEFGPKGRISGASIEFYMLEKSRVITQAPEERNYHIFYQLLKGASKAQRMRLGFDDKESIDDFAYLKNGVADIDGVNDAQRLEETETAFKIMGFTGDNIANIFEVVATVLHLGNIKFSATSADQGRVGNPEQVAVACKLLGVSPELFTKAMLRPRVRAGTELVSQSRTAAQAQFAVDALAKALYERLFGYIVSQLNVRLGSGTNKTSFIGVLDIAGFEIFRHNSFEQLFINYTNEKLQQFFNHHMFVLEQEEYIKEDIEWDYVDYGSDLQPTIDLIERISPMGIFSCLDEECVVPQATDATFTDKLVERWNGNNAKFSASRLHQGFIVNHYAMAVEYSTEGWLDKNRDPLSDSVTELMASSTNSLVKQLFTDKPAGEAPPADTQVVSRRSKLRTVAQKHREQLNNLMTQLESTSPHFVRCIIPNKHRKPDEFDNMLVLDQLRCNGVLEGIRLARAGYPNRLDFRDFCMRYHVLVPNEPSGGSSQRACSAILQRLKLDEDTYKVGLTKVFFRGGVLAHLEDRLDALVKEQTLLVQSFGRAHLVRKRVRAELHRKEATKTLARTFKTWKNVHDDPWWKLLALQRPLLDSQGNLDSSRKDMRIQKLQESLGELHALSDKQQENIDNLEREVKSLRDERDCLQADKVADSTKRNKELDKFRVKLRDLEQELDELRGAKDKVMADLKATTAKLAAETDKVTPLQDKIAAAEQKLITEVETSTDLRKQLEDAQKKAELAVTEAAAAKKEREQLQHKLSDKTTAFKQLETAHAKLNDTQLANVTERDAVQARLDKLGREHKDLETKHRGLGEELAKASAASAALESKHKDIDGERAKWTASQSKLQSAHDELVAKLASLEKGNSTLKQQSAAKEAEFATVKEQHAKDLAAAKSAGAKNSATELARVKTASAAAEDRLNKQLAATQTDLSEVKDQLARAKSDAASHERKASELSNKLEDKMSYVTSLEAQLEKQSQRIAQLEAAAMNATPQTAIAVAGASARARTRAIRQFSPPSSNMEQDLVDLQNELASEKANSASLNEELMATRRELVEVPKLKDRLERLRREKAQLADEKSQMMFSTMSQRSQFKELEIEKAKSSEGKKLQSEIRVLKLQLVRSERSRNAAIAAAEAAANSSSAETSDVAQLTQKLRVAELAKVQLQQQLLRQQAQLDNELAPPTTLPLARYSPTRIPSAPRAAEPNLVVRKRDIPSALRVISNDRRVSEQIYVDAATVEKSRTVSTSEDLQEMVSVYKRRAEGLHSELEKAELVVAAAVRNEEAAQEQMASLKRRVASLESSHGNEVTELTQQVRVLKRQIADNELDLSMARENERLVRDLEAQLRSLGTTMEDIKAERDRLLVSKQKLERRLGDAADLSERPRRLVEQLSGLQREVKTRERVAEDLRWQIERRDKLVEQLKRTLSDSDAREEQLREQVDRLQAMDSAKDVALRRSKRDIAQAREQTLIIERELLNYRSKPTTYTPSNVSSKSTSVAKSTYTPGHTSKSKSYSSGPAFI